MIEKIFQPSIYIPTQPRTGVGESTLLRLSNLILVGVGADKYLQCYNGTLDLEETIETEALTGTITITADEVAVVGTGTLFNSELRSGQRIFCDGFFFVIDQIADDAHCTVYKAPDENITAQTALRMPVIYEIQNQRGTQIDGNAVEADKGTILGAGSGTVRINGEPLSGVGSASVTKLVGTGSDDNAVGTVAWSNPDNISAGGNATSVPGNGATTHYLKGNHFGFAIDSGATIIGIEVVINRYLGGVGTETVADSAVKIVKANGTVGSANKALAGNWSAVSSDAIYGGSADLWSEAWAPADINDVDFGVVMSATATDPATDGFTLNVVSYTITVFYTFPSGGMVLDGEPQIAIYDRDTNTYSIYPLGFDAPTTNPTVTSVAGGTHNMQSGNYSARLVPSRTATNGYNNPGPQVPFTIVTNGDFAQFDFSSGPAMDTAKGQDEWDVYASENIDSIPVNVQGPWNFVRTITAQELIDGGNLAPIDFANSEINRLGLLDFNNNPPPPCGYVAFLEGGPVWISCRGKLSDTFGPSIRPSKPRNIEAAPADWDVSSSPPQNLFGFTTSLARLYFPTPSSLQQGVYLGSTDPFQITPSVSMRPYWHVGFNHGNQLVFDGEDLYGYPHQGPTRSVANAEKVAEQFFGQQVAEIIKTWTSAHVFVGYDPQLSATCYFHSADSKNENGFWRTRVLVWGVEQQGWIGDAWISRDDRDMCVCGVATVQEHLQFLAGGSTVDTWQFNTISGEEVPYYVAWSGVSAPSQNLSVRAARATGKFTDGLLQIFGYDEDIDIDYDALEAGTGALIDLPMTTTTGIVRKFRERFNAPNCGLAILRVSGTWAGADGQPDRVDGAYAAAIPSGNRR